MRFVALATDYDGTIAHDGHVEDATIAALEKLRTSGRKLLLVTGRHLPNLKDIFPRLDLFDKVVAENGALLYDPATQETETLCEAPNPAFLNELKQHGVPFEAGHCIVATWEPHQQAVLDAIKAQGLELQVIFNKGSVMVLPSGLHKGSGMKKALAPLGISPHNVVGFGDAENDHAFLRECECSVAVANALESLKQQADIVTEQARGAGVTAIVEQLLEDDLRRYSDQLKHGHVLLGKDKETAEELNFSANRGVLLVCGASGSGKSTALTGIVERAAARGYQVLLVDPEGDYDNLPQAIVHGTQDNPPDREQVLKTLDSSMEHGVVANLLALPLQDRPQFYPEIMQSLTELRHRTGRPHWIVIDESHHMLPAESTLGQSVLNATRDGVILVTVHPRMVNRAILEKVDTVLAIGSSARELMQEFAESSGKQLPQLPNVTLETGQALAWEARHADRVRTIVTERGKTERRRHVRKYAEGELPEECSFYFKGPENKLNLRAQNLILFTQIADGVDDETWLHHLRHNDYSTWIRNQVKDNELADGIVEVESNGGDPRQSRASIKKLILEKYTL